MKVGLSSCSQSGSSVLEFVFQLDFLVYINTVDHMYVRNIDKYGISHFKIKLSYETWDNVFENNDVNCIYNSFLNTYLRVFYSSFPLRKLITKTNSNAWITTGIRTTFKHKRDLYLPCRSNNNPLLKNHYKLYCKLLSNVIREAKKCHNNKQIENSKNKMTTTWAITRTLTEEKAKNEDIHQLNINGDIRYNFRTIPDFFLTTTFYYNREKSQWYQ
jgi:hypothetical protein